MSHPRRELPQISPTVVRQFAAGWLLFFGALAAVQISKHRAGLAYGYFSAAAVGPLLAWLTPVFLAKVFSFARAVTAPIGWLISEVIFAVLYFAVFTPVGLFFRIRGRDRLRL